ncbi:MAG: copper resistance protein CopC/CopD [Alphaproteobacteria bacterium]|nr:copper resistance protein CopC/CopD [Alphaproteobacteria bacterium]
MPSLLGLAWAPLRGAVLVLVAMCAACPPAWAHASLVASEPADGARLETAPEAVVLVFNEPVTVVGVQVVDAAGTILDLPAPTAAAERVTQGLPRALPPGRYLVAWRVVSADGHPILGAIAFGIGADVAAGTMVEARHGALAIVLRALLFAAALATLGGAWTARLRAGGDETWSCRLVRGAAPLAVAALVLLRLTAAAELSPQALPWPEAIGTIDTWRLALDLPGQPAAIMVMAGAALAAAMPGGALAIGGAALLVAGVALTGHQATAEPRPLAAAAAVAHGLAAALWVGALPGLLRAIAAAGTSDAAALLRQFSRRAPAIVAVLLLAGLALAWLQLRSFEALASTPYGRILMAKLAAVALMLALGALNRWRLTAELAAGRSGARTRLRASIGAELLLAALAVAATALLGSAVPPRSRASLEALPAPASAAVAREVAADGRTALIEVQRHGAHGQVLVDAIDRDGGPLGAQQGWLVLAHPASGVAGLRRPLAPQSLGSWAWHGPELGVAGLWHLQVELLVSDFEKAVFSVDVRLP